MNPTRFDIGTIINSSGWRCTRIERRLGISPSSAFIEYPYDGAEPPSPPAKIEVYAANSLVFSGSLSVTKLVHELKNPVYRAEYKDARRFLTSTACPGFYARNNGGIEEIDGRSVIFNRLGEGNLAVGEPLAFSITPLYTALWTALDILRYLEEYAFSLPPLCENIEFRTDCLDDDVSKRLERHIPINSKATGKSVAEIVAELAEATGLLVRLDDSQYPSRLELFTPFSASSEIIELDAGMPNGSLDPNEPPDIFSFELEEGEKTVPESVTVEGISLQAEITVMTGIRITDSGEFEECPLNEGGVIPAWSRAEESRYEWIKLTDPTGTNTELNAERKRLWHVYRLYGVNPELRLGALFSPAVQPDTEFEPAVGFSQNAKGEVPPPEVVLELNCLPGWRSPCDEWDNPIGVRMLERGRYILFDRPVCLNGSAECGVNASRIGYTLCLQAKFPFAVSVEAGDVFGSEFHLGKPAHYCKKGYVWRVTVPGIVRKQWSQARLPGERDDSDILNLAAWVALERFTPLPSLKISVNGLYPDLREGSRIGAIAFERAGGGDERFKITPRSIVKHVVFDVEEHRTEILAGRLQ